MAASSTPHFQNDMGLSKIEIGAKEFMCVGAKPPFDHPHVFLNMGAGGRNRLPLLLNPVQAQRQAQAGRGQARSRRMARRGRITRPFTIREYRDSDEAQVVELVRELQAFEVAAVQVGKTA